VLHALLTQVEGLATRQPVIIVFEDVHWIDPTSRLTFRRSRAQFGANFLCTFLELERLLGDAEQCEQLTLQIRELGVEDLHGVAVLGQCVPLYEAEQT
jgi:hypothetical protein